MSWNGRLEPDELRRQVRILHRMGMGGFFIHARVGLDTAYLSDDWFDCVDACIDEAQKLGMRAWLYDEDRWPSGAAGGLVTKDPKYRQRFLAMEQLKKPADLKWKPGVVAAFTAAVDGNTVRDVTRIATGKRPAALAKGESILVFRDTMVGCSPWYNGYAYLDTLSHEAVRKFIQVTHEEYRKRCGKHFGKTVPGIFTDEPNYGWGIGGVPWTPRLPQAFRKRYGYDVLDYLPELFYDRVGQKYSRARYHYFDCITFLFVDAFSRQIGQWCDANGMEFTGHALCEDTLSSQACLVGNCMRFYEYMQAPGMDLLTERWRIYDTAKQVSSAARQFGRKWRLTETYGCTGWDFPFAGHKALGDWQVALGINLRCQHLSWYTMLGECKRDYPAAIFYQSPWWELYPKVEDYYGRVQAVMTRGREVRDLLVVHPIESAWLLTAGREGRKQETAELDASFIAVRDSLLAGNIDFDYGDEELLTRHARVVGGKGGPKFIMAKAAYRAVVVPPMLTIRSSTLALLKKFKAAGGTVVFAGPAPQYVDAEPSPAAVEFARKCRRAPAKGSALVRAVEPTCRRVSIADAGGKEIFSTLYLLREDAEAFYLFVCNNGLQPRQVKPNINDVMVRDRKAAYGDVRVRGFAGCKGLPIELDAETGKAYAASAVARKGGWEIRTSLPALGSRLFVIPKKGGGKKFPARKALRDVRGMRLGAAKWDIALSEDNVLVLDRPRYRIAGGKWRGPDDVLRIDVAVRDAMGIPHRGGAMMQPWARPKPADPKRTGVTLAYNFNVKTPPGGSLYLALERPETFTIRVNGQTLSSDAECGWWCDKSLRKIAVDPSLLRAGDNEIVLDCDYSENHSGLEIVYLLGNFGTQVKGTEITMTAAPQTLRLGDWVNQGLAFYSGAVSYCRTIRPRVRKGERLFVEVPDYRGAAVRVLVNGQAAGVIGWEPNEVDITDYVGDGPVELRIELVSHRRNSHGPLHLNEKWPFWHGPGSYTTTGKQWIDGYQLVPCGLMAPPNLVVRR
ncbi:MAG TPA: glycosyl hydrolase [Phycisphaerae bacterium]|nr:glycosyl hydrolase [Phycisphaerae bacterium]